MSGPLDILRSIARRGLAMAGTMLHDAPLALPDGEGIVRFRERLTRLKAMSVGGGDTSWHSFCEDLVREAGQGSASEFLNWPTIQRTMFVSRASYLDGELAHLRADALWSTRWRPALVEAQAGRPPPFRSYPATSGNTIHHLYHLCRFGNWSGLAMADFDSVLEWGGGYGNLCRLVYKVGFSGRYCIYDLPAFSALQELYLGMVGLHARGAETGPRERTVLTSDWAVVHGALDAAPGESLFVATWSLSETPLAERARAESVLPGSSAVLIAYQAEFDGVDNEHYFRRLAESLHGSHRCAFFPIDHLPGSSYFFAQRKKTSDERQPESAKA